MGFSRQEYWIRLPFSSPGNLPDPGMEPGSPPLQADSLPSEPGLYQIQILSVAAILNLHCARESSRVSSRKASSMFSARCLDSHIKSIADGKLLYKQELNPALCDNLEGWSGAGGGGERFKRKGHMVFMADLHCCMAKTSMVLQLSSNQK